MRWVTLEQGPIAIRYNITVGVSYQTGMESSDDTMPPDSTDVTVASEGTVPSPSLAVGSETIATSGSEIREELDTDAAQSSQLPEGSADSTSAEQKTDQVGTVLGMRKGYLLVIIICNVYLLNLFF